MSRVIGILFILFTAAAAAFAFSPRIPPPLPETEIHIEQLLMLGAQRMGDRLICVGEWGNVFVSDDGGKAWRRAVSPTEATLTALAVLDDRHAVAVGHDAVILRSDDRGESWTQVYAAPEDGTPLLGVWFDASGHGFAIGAYGAALESADGGVSWEDRRLDEEELHLNALTQSIDGALLVVGEAGTMLRSRDDGETWERIASPYEGSFFGALATADGGLLAFGMRGHVLRTSDEGDTWEEVSSGVLSSIFGGRVLADGTIVLAGQNGVVLTSSDQGRHFVEREMGERLTRSAVLAGASPDELVLFGEQGVSHARLQAGAGVAQ
jgi:photosystem II stability/assembly factor-like uncharacterized protein